MFNKEPSPVTIATTMNIVVVSGAFIGGSISPSP
jgi:hypothetical protein